MVGYDGMSVQPWRTTHQTRASYALEVLEVHCGKTFVLSLNPLNLIRRKTTFALYHRNVHRMHWTLPNPRDCKLYCVN